MSTDDTNDTSDTSDTILALRAAVERAAETGMTDDFSAKLDLRLTLAKAIDAAVIDFVKRTPNTTTEDVFEAFMAAFALAFNTGVFHGEQPVNSFSAAILCCLQLSKRLCTVLVEMVTNHFQKKES